ncbi:hypothetical protein CHARACLAT_002279 [Characodon lateralis]|uniref:Uncharacterized protein n=1 Tax=Characodon lateralis TaxID=208331 RepID=A0ABU7E7P8_9TELE|nr:hypothetical protein [Characodon lateralis]
MSHINTHMLTSYREPLLNPPPPSSPSLFVFLMLALSRSNIGVFLTVNFSLSISFTQHLFSSFFSSFSLLPLLSLIPFLTLAPGQNRLPHNSGCIQAGWCHTAHCVLKRRWVQSHPNIIVFLACVPPWLNVYHTTFISEIHADVWVLACVPPRWPV